MRGTYALSALIIMVAVVVSAIVAAYVIVGSAVSLQHRALSVEKDLNCVLSSASSGQDPSGCLEGVSVRGACVAGCGG